MERAEILLRLAEAHTAVRLGSENVRQQRNLGLQLERHLQLAEAGSARALLSKLEDSLALDVEHLDHIANELAGFDRGSDL